MLVRLNIIYILFSGFDSTVKRRESKQSKIGSLSSQAWKSKTLILSTCRLLETVMLHRFDKIRNEPFRWRLVSTHVYAALLPG
jgi:hypothetical protein